MRTLIVREGRSRRATFWHGWRDWRAGRRGSPAPGAAAAVGQCPTCWGQRAIWEPGPLGLLPVLCGTCDGRGGVALAR